MKKLIILFEILVMIFFTIELRADHIPVCPNGWQVTRVYNIWINGCQYNADVCHLCGMISGNLGISIESFWKLDNNCQQTWNIQQVTEAIQNYIYSWPIIKQFICLSAEITPCNSGNLTVEFRKAMCWQKINDSGHIDIIKCGTCVCVETWEFCFDGGYSQHLVSAVREGCNFDENGVNLDCPNEGNGDDGLCYPSHSTLCYPY